MLNNPKLFNRIYSNTYQPYLLQKLDYIFASIIFFISLFVYFKTLNPSVTAGDSGELITTVYNMGASHPPGFPLYGIIGKLFTFLRFPDIGYKMNIFSGVSAAVAVLFAYFSIVKLLGFNRNVSQFSPAIHIPAISGSLLFAFSKAHWSQAIMAEVYALNAALCSLMFFIMIVWYEEIMTYRDEKDSLWLAPRITFLLAFIMGLSITNHQIPVWYIISWALMLVPIIIILISSKNEDFIKQFEERKFPIINLSIVSAIALILLVVSSIKPYMLFPEIIPGEYRLIFPQHVPYILTAIFCVPIWLTCYSFQNYLYKLQHTSSVNKTLLDTLHAIFFTIILGIVVYSFFFLQGIHALFIIAPLIIITIYQFSQKDDLHKRYQNNWIDEFLFILTIAMWLLIFAMSIYLYMWIRAKAIAPLIEPKPLSWGDTQTLDILFNHMLRKQYPVGTDDYSNLLGQFGSLAKYHINQFGTINFILGLIGIGYFVKREPIQATYFVLSSFIYLWSIVDFINFEVDPRSLETQEVFFIQQFLIYSIFISFAYQLLLDIPNLISKFSQKIKR